MVDGLFVEEDAELIKKIPLSKKVTEDVLFWPFTSNGVYSSKFGYRFLKEEADQLDTSKAPPLQDRNLWSAVWAMRVPQKVKNFIWRACRNAMPTKQSPVRRTIITDPTCDRCRSETESPLHALWSCPEVEIVWVDLTLWDFRSHVSFGDFKQLVSWLVEEDKQLDLFAFMAWSIWHQRNLVQAEPSSHRLQINWLPPSMNVVKINFDGAVFLKENRSGIGVVVRDENGLVLGSCTKSLSQAYSATEIEAMAAATALVFASELGIRRAILEGDSIVVIKALIEEDYPLNPLGSILEDVKMFAQRFDTLLFSHTKREDLNEYMPLANVSP
ncbi:hypothetical protein SO802_027161 [Lithocarpus litseifolius]|uniref:Reverse transcriptase zinc-binding domain-containing protein n=1 Tax=Lithocarpus litseifolius TaxID=425828 RepID=A0AAW2C1R9_9ROSI